jgi:hypothetical protein
MRTLFLLLCVVLASVPAQEAPADLCGRFVAEDGFRTLYLWGTPHERGFAHGYLLADVIVRSLDQDLAKLMQGARLVQYEKRLLPLIVPQFAFSPDEEAELRGILEGIERRLPDEEQRRLSIVDRLITLGDLKAANTVGDWMALGCSSFTMNGSFSEDGKPVAARNFDFPAYRMVLDDQHLVVVQAGDGRRGYAGVSYPGCVGIITGMNDEGVFVAIHDVFVPASPMTTIRRNVPRLCALRRLLEEVAASGAIESTEEKLASWPTLYGNNFMLVTPESAEGQPGAAVFEYDNRRNLTGGVAVRTVDGIEEEDSPFLICTNHHRLRPKGLFGRDPSACRRYAALHSLLEEKKKDQAISVADIFGALSIAAFPEPEQVQRRYRHGTTHQVVAFTGKKELHVKLGEVGKNIRDVRSKRCVVPMLLAGVRGAPVTTAPSGGVPR